MTNKINFTKKNTTKYIKMLLDIKILTKQFIRKQIGKLGYVTDFHTPISDILSLIKKFHCYKVGKELIRVGAKGDGGYLVPDDLKGITTCFSAGVGDLSSFEQDCQRLGMSIFLADNSVEKVNLEPGTYSFIKKHIGLVNNEKFITMESWVNESGIDKTSDLLLQMDIESAEYFAIMSMPEHLIKQLRVLVFEFHGLSKLWNPEYYNVVNSAVDKILSTHTCVHVHPNNVNDIYNHLGVELPTAIEVTYIRNDRVKEKHLCTTFPHPKDSDVTSNRPSVVLPKQWYS